MIRLPHWSFKEFVGTVNTSGLSSVLNAGLWVLTGFFTIWLMQWATIGAPNADIALKRVAALLALLPFHAAWCGYLLARTGANIVQKAINRSTDIDFVKAKGEVEALKVDAAGKVEALKVEALKTNGSPIPVAGAEAQPEWADVPGRGLL